MVPNPLKISLWGSLGWLWGCSWRPSGAGATSRAQKVETSKILGSPREPKIHQKSILKLMKISRIFHIDFGTTFSWFWDDLFSKNLSKMEGLGGVFSTSLRICEKCDFERPSIVFATFFNFENINFRTQIRYSSVIFLWRFQDLLFFDLGMKFGPCWRPNEP